MQSSVGILCVPNIDKFQHYKDRNPPWIKLYQSLLTDYGFATLPDASKSHLIAIWLLASCLNNRIPADPKWLSGRINATEPVDLQILIDNGFLEWEQGCSNTLASCKQSAIPETETETETETDLVPNGTYPTGSPEGSPAGVSHVPYQAILDLYHRLLTPPLARVTRLSSDRKRHISARWHAELPDLETWEAYFRAVARSRLPKGWLYNGTPWKPGLDYLLREKTLTAIEEGKYDP